MTSSSASESHATGVNLTRFQPITGLNFTGPNPILAAMQFGICNEIFTDWKLEDAMAFARKAGYDAIEIAPFTIAKYVTDISPASRKEIRESAARAGIAISAIHWVLVKAEGMYLNHPDAAVRTRTAKYFCDLVGFCADIGGKRSWSDPRNSAMSWRAWLRSKRGTGRAPRFATR